MAHNSHDLLDIDRQLAEAEADIQRRREIIDELERDGPPAVAERVTLEEQVKALIALQQRRDLIAELLRKPQPPDAPPASMRGEP
jgi:hypothetical protein